MRSVRVSSFVLDPGPKHLSSAAWVSAWHDQQVKILHRERKSRKEGDQSSSCNVRRHKRARPHCNAGTVDRRLERVVQGFEPQLGVTEQVGVACQL